MAHFNTKYKKKNSKFGTLKSLKPKAKTRLLNYDIHGHQHHYPNLTLLKKKTTQYKTVDSSTGLDGNDSVLKNRDSYLGGWTDQS